MAIPFSQIPANLLVPGQYQEIDNSLAGSQGEIKKVLLVGMKSSTGTSEAGKPVRILSSQKAGKAFGFGSPAAIMAEHFLASNKVEELHVLPVEEPSAGTKWTKKVVVESSNAGEGSVMLTVNGRAVWSQVTEGMPADEIAGGVVAACNGLKNNPVEASMEDDGGAIKLVFSSIVKGTSGNKNTVSLKPQAFGVKIKEESEIKGTGVSDLSELPKMLGSTRWNYIVFDFDDEQSIKVLSEELESRYSAMRQIGGRAFIALSGTPEELIQQANKINSPHIVLIPRGSSKLLPCVWGSRFAGTACRILADDPSANTYDAKVLGLAEDSSYDFNIRQKLLESGIVTYRLDPIGNVLIERLVTSYTENTDGGRDTSYLDVQVVETVDTVRTYINAEAKKRFKKWKLASTNENFGAGAKVMSPAIWHSFLADLYQTVFIQEKNWCQDFESYKSSIFVEVKAGSKTRLEYIHQPVLIGQFLIGAGLNQFK